MISSMQVAKLLGRAPSAAEMDALHRLQSSLNAHDDDAILAVMIALGSHQQLLADFPEQVQHTIDVASRHARASAEKQIAAATAVAQAEMAKAVSITAQQVAQDVTRRSLVRWVAAAFMIICLSLLATGYLARQAGLSQGYQLGLGKARDERAAASWANTPNARQAMILDRHGLLRRILQCDFDGWYIKNGTCFPGQAKGGGMYGYPLP